MSNSEFETIAIELAEKSSDCLREIDELDANLQSISESTDGSFEGFNSSFSDLEDSVRLALERIEELGNDISNRLDGFGENCSKTLDTLENIRSSFAEQIEAAKTHAEESGELIQTIRSDQASSWQDISSNNASLLEGYINLSDHSTVSANELTGEISDKVVSLLSDIPSKLEGEASVFGELVEDGKIELIAEQSSEFASKSEDTSLFLKDGLEELGGAMEDSVANAVESMNSSYDEQISDLIETANELASSFSDIADQVSSSAESVSDTFEMIDTLTDATNVGLHSALKVFEESKELLERIV